METDHLTLHDLSQHFHRTAVEAAKELGVCGTLLKKICRQNGITRWPQRKLQSLNKSIMALETELSKKGKVKTRERLKRDLMILQTKKKLLMKDPNAEVTRQRKRNNSGGKGAGKVGCKRCYDSMTESSGKGAEAGSYDGTGVFTTEHKVDEPTRKSGRLLSKTRLVYLNESEEDEEGVASDEDEESNIESSNNLSGALGPHLSISLPSAGIPALYHPGCSLGLSLLTDATRLVEHDPVPNRANLATSFVYGDSVEKINSDNALAAFQREKTLSNMWMNTWLRGPVHMYDTGMMHSMQTRPALPSPFLHYQNSPATHPSVPNKTLMPTICSLATTTVVSKDTSKIEPSYAFMQHQHVHSVKN